MSNFYADMLAAMPVRLLVIHINITNIVITITAASSASTDAWA